MRRLQIEGQTMARGLDPAVREPIHSGGRGLFWVRKTLQATLECLKLDIEHVEMLMDEYISK